MNLSDLVKGAREVDAMPKVTRKGEPQENEMLPLVQESYLKKKGFALPPTQDAIMLKKAELKARYAARDLNVGVKIRKIVSEEGTSLFIEGQERNTRA